MGYLKDISEPPASWRKRNGLPGCTGCICGGGGITHQTVPIKVEFQRDKNFTDPIEFKVGYKRQDGTVNYADFFPPAVSSGGRADDLECRCSFAEGTFSEIQLTVLRNFPDKDGTPHKIRIVEVLGSAEAKTTLEIEVRSRVPGKENEEVTAWAAKALEISCLRASPDLTRGPRVAVPGVIGLTPAAATGRLQSVGFSIRETDRVDDTCKNIGVVSGQSPLAGTAAIQGSTVTIFVGKRPPHPCP